MESGAEARRPYLDYLTIVFMDFEVKKILAYKDYNN